MTGPPSVATSAVLITSGNAENELLDQGHRPVRGPDFNSIITGSNNGVANVDYEKLISSYANIGFQATSVGAAIAEINRMLNWRLSDVPMRPDESAPYDDPEVRASTRCKIFLGYTSNLVSSGIRELIKFLAQHKLVDVLVSSAGGIEEDFIKCMASTYIGDFALKGADLRKRGLNRIGNLLVPNNNYCAFEDWLIPILDQMLIEQERDGINWTPSKVIHRLGKEINHEDSIYYWAYKNNIPVYCPALTDGSLGDMLYFHSYKNPGLRIDMVEDIRRINNEAVFARATGMIILGGGIVKHHICNANLMRNGADFSVFINTGQEFDGSDAGARPDEAVSWGKIRIEANPVKVYSDASIVFPIIVAQTFAHELIRRREIPK